jgi:hypothetical protein
VIRLVELLLVLVPVVGAIIAVTRTISAARDRGDDPRGPIQEAIPTSETGNPAAQWRTITRALDEHRRTDDRWLSYELDAAKLLDFPLMTDMRDPLTTRFHGAKFRADLLRPAKAEDLLDDREVTRDYLDAVQEYVTAFNAAEAEAIRRRRNDFSHADQQRLARAQSLLRVASDTSATAQERGQAYALAGKELDGLIVLPDNTRAAIERGVAGELDG